MCSGFKLFSGSSQNKTEPFNKFTILMSNIKTASAHLTKNNLRKKYIIKIPDFQSFAQNNAERMVLIYRIKVYLSKDIPKWGLSIDQ